MAGARRNGVNGGLLLMIVTLVVLLAVLVALLNRPDHPTRPAALTPPPVTTSPEPTLPPTFAPWDGEVTPSPEAPQDQPSYVAPTGGGPSPSAAPQSRPAYAAVAGNGCTETAASGAYASFTAVHPITQQAGGWTGTGCPGGRYWSVPMSGDAQRDDEATSITWWFATAGLSRGRCEVWVYVPKPAVDGEAAGHPTHYYVTTGRGSTTVLGQFSVDQVASRGAWASGGSFPLQGGQIAVLLANRGTGSGRHAAAQIQVGCWAA